MNKYTLRFAQAVGAVPQDRELENYPGGFGRWIERRSFKLKTDVPPHWSASFPTGTRPRLAVVMHVYFPELVDELLQRLENVPVPFDLLITNASGVPLEIDPKHLPLARHIGVFTVDNQGRDILPLVLLANSGVLDPYELLLKVHTKKSVWREQHHDLNGSGETWREGFLSDLLGTTARVESILGNFDADPTLGLVTSAGNVLGPEFWGGDERTTRDLLRRLQLDLEPERLRFAAGSMYWIRGFLIQGLRALDLSSVDFEAEAGQVDGTTAHAIERAIGVLTSEAGYRIADTSSPDLVEGDWTRFSPTFSARPAARAIAFYLPQFHTFEENDRWWGNGFTEWSNVAAARPVYLGQNQPLLPERLGFYDLSSDLVRENQSALAKTARLDGFMYYYYWFAGKKLMQKPIEALSKGSTETPFCIMWANENWTRRWDGSDEDILIGQDYEQVPATQFIHDVMDLLVDERYIRLHGRPILAVYRITQIPDFEAVLEYWRAAAVEAGLPGLEILTVDVGEGMQGVAGDPKDHGLDGQLQFAPHNIPWTAQPTDILELDRRFSGNAMSYAKMVAGAEKSLTEPTDATHYPGVMVNFDNTARRQWKPDLWYGSNPYTFRRWLRSAVESVADREYDDRVIFINAWNEWAESAVLEPTQRWGATYILATRDALA